MSTEYQLWRGDDLLGRLRPYATDFPWVNCKFEASAAFAECEPLFAEELRLLDAEDMAAWEASYDKIHALSLRLVGAGGGDEVGEFLLHIDGDEAWFRFQRGRT